MGHTHLDTEGAAHGRPETSHNLGSGRRSDGEPTVQIKEALNEILDSHGIHVKDVAIRAQPAGRDPRTAVHKQLGGGVTNQARLVPSDALPGVDRMASRREELRVYGVFKRDQAALPPGDTLTIAVNPYLRLSTSTWEPDPLISTGAG